MKLKLFVVVLTLMLVVPTLAQEKVIREEFGIKKVLDLDEEAASIQLLSDKARAVSLVTFLWVTGPYPEHMIKLSQVDTIHFYTDFVVTKPTNVRFHYIFTGPEYYEYITDWKSTSRNTYHYVDCITNNNWQKGIYTLTVIAEQGSNASGAECMSTCRFRFY